ncbi:MAG: M50 family metallopeptidase, partial [Candidatus Micrarchaeota archaeon]
ANGASLSNAMPGASPVIPGINMPLVEGILALGLLLFIHELSHGILSRIGKIKLESAGLLLYGLIPVGAFIDPSEPSLAKKGLAIQTRVFAAGSASNLILFILAFFALISFEAFTAPYLDSGVYLHSVELNSPAYDAGLKTGDRIVSVDEIPISWENVAAIGSTIAQRERVMVKTDTNSYLLQPRLIGDRKFIGIRLEQQPRYLSEFSYLAFAKNTLGLILILNFLVGVINLIPLFLAFDGYRIFTLHVKNQGIIKLVSYSLLAMFLLNFAPWLWT